MRLGSASAEALDAASRLAPHPNSRFRWVVRVLFVLVCVLFIVQAWISDDAYISFRSVENFVQGRGLVWNTGERVQAFTHPLWLLLLGAFCRFTDEYYLTPLLVSLVLSIASVWVLMRLAPATWRSQVAALLALGLSVAFVSYTTSGLENPLTFFLLALFLAVFWSRRPAPKRLLLLGLIGGLAMVNRFDNVYLFGVPMLFAFWEEKGWKARRFLLLGCAPIVAWVLFALVYYGSIMPNSAIAKLNTGIPHAAYLRQGGVYFIDALLFDPLTLGVILWSLAAAYKGRSRELLPLGVGIVLYLLYVAWVGGDFMRGRFLAAAFFLGVAILLRTGFPLPGRLAAASPLLILVLALPTLDRAILLEPHNRKRHDAQLAKSGIGDERAYYPDSRLTRHALASQVGHDMTSIRSFRAGDPARVRLVSTAGRSGFMSGPAVYVIDSFALTNPLLSRLAIREDRKWRIGHFERRVPEGYLSMLLDPNAKIVNPTIRDLYTKIESVTRGKLFAAQRWKHIFALNNPFTRQVYVLPQKEIVEPAECVALARTKLEVLDLQLIWGAAKSEILAGHLESAKVFLGRLFWLLREKPRSFFSRRDYLLEVTELAKSRSAERFGEAEDLLLFAIAEMPNRREPLLTLAELYDQVQRGPEAAALRDRAIKLPPS